MMSHRIMHEVFLTITDQFEQVSVDEGYMDVSGALLEWDKPSAIGAWIRQQVAERFNVTCSVGIACNKLVAKMASTNAKPNGMLLIPAARSAQFVQMMPLRGIPGIGPSLEKRLNAWGVHSVAELAQMMKPLSYRPLDRPPRRADCGRPRMVWIHVRSQQPAKRSPSVQNAP